MPTYDYVCQDCAQPFEVRLSMAEYSDCHSPACPYCGSARVFRKFTAAGLATGSRTGGPDGYCGPSAGPGCCG